MKASDYSCVPLCTDCHTQAPGAYRRIGRPAFETVRGVCLEDLVVRLNEAWGRICA
jgi:hypothetical protein